MASEQASTVQGLYRQNSTPQKLIIPAAILLNVCIDMHFILF
jgi:hypothetical protein